MEPRVLFKQSKKKDKDNANVAQHPDLFKQRPSVTQRDIFHLQNNE